MNPERIRNNPEPLRPRLEGDSEVFIKNDHEEMSRTFRMIKQHLAEMAFLNHGSIPLHMAERLLDDILADKK